MAYGTFVFAILSLLASSVVATVHFTTFCFWRFRFVVPLSTILPYSHIGLNTISLTNTRMNEWLMVTSLQLQLKALNRSKYLSYLVATFVPVPKCYLTDRRIALLTNSPREDSAYAQFLSARDTKVYLQDIENQLLELLGELNETGRCRAQRQTGWRSDSLRCQFAGLLRVHAIRQNRIPTQSRNGFAHQHAVFRRHRDLITNQQHQRMGRVTHGPKSQLLWEEQPRRVHRARRMFENFCLWTRDLFRWQWWSPRMV